MEEYNFSNESSFDLIKEGTYEVILDKAELKKTNNNKNYIECKFKIRDDVEQEFKGRCVFDKIWPDKDHLEMFDMNKLQSLLLVQGKGGVYKFKTNADLIQFLNKLVMRITVVIKPADDYHSEEYNEVKYRSYRPSKVQPKTLTGQTPEEYGKQVFGDDFSVESDDLPF